MIVRRWDARASASRPAPSVGNALKEGPCQALPRHKEPCLAWPGLASYAKGCPEGLAQDLSRKPSKSRPPISEPDPVACCLYEFAHITPVEHRRHEMRIEF